MRIILLCCCWAPAISQLRKSMDTAESRSSRSLRVEQKLAKDLITQESRESEQSSVRGPEGRIIGGSFAPVNEYPWFARGVTRADTTGSILWKGCAGVLVAPEFVLTAAHCKYDSATSGFQIGAMCSPFVTGLNCGQDVELKFAKAVFEHPDYKEDGFFNDLALVQLESQSTIPPVPIDRGDVASSYTGAKSLWVVGLGIDSQANFGSEVTYPGITKHVEVDFVNEDICSSIITSFVPGLIISDDQMCAGNADFFGNKKGICNGDSGGPLYDKENNVLVGITSWLIQGYDEANNIDVSCGRTPQVYSNIGYQWEWIYTTICENHNEENYPEFCDEYRSSNPTKTPSMSPTTANPTNNPTSPPTNHPSNVPTINPRTPTSKPSYKPAYNPSSTTPEINPSRSPTVNEECIRVMLNLRTDNYPNETSWDIYDVYGSILSPLSVAGHADYELSGTLYEYEYCLPAEICYLFEMRDSFGDGIIVPGGYFLAVNEKNVASSYYSVNGNFSFGERIQFGECSPSIPTCKEDEMRVKLALQTDSYPNETSWGIVAVNDMSDEASVAGYDEYDYVLNNVLYQYEYCLPSDQCYMWEIGDRYGDGIFLPSGYNLTVDDVIIVSSYDDSNGGFNYTESAFFGDCSLMPLTCKEDEIHVEVDVLTDLYPFELEWFIHNELNSTSSTISETSYELSNTVYKHEYCLPSDQCYKFEMKDSYGDGIIYPSGYNLTVDGSIVSSSYDDYKGDFDYNETVDFGDCFSSEPACNEDEIHVVFDLQTHSNTNGMWWVIQTGTEIVFSERYFDPNTLYQYKYCLPADKCHIFSIFFFGGFDIGGGYNLTVNDEVVGTSYDGSFTLFEMYYYGC